MRIAMYEPDIPQNLGAMMRLSACLDLPLDIIEPCGFIWSDKKIGRAAMDYKDAVEITKHNDWNSFTAAYPGRRIVLMTTKASVPYADFTFKTGDILLAGRESAGVPDHVHEYVQGRVVIPMAEGLRSLNIVNATSMIAGEALRQTRWSM